MTESDYGVQTITMDRKSKKSVQAINYIARKTEGNSINRLKMLKLLWIADRYHLLNYGRMILKDRYYAMEHGPVASETYDISQEDTNQYIEKYLTPSFYDVKSIQETDKKFFSESDIEVLDLVWDKFGHLSRWQLRDITHHYPEWKRFEEELQDEFTPDSYPMELIDFFIIPVPTDENFSNFFEVTEGKLFEAKQAFNLRKKFEG